MNVSKNIILLSNFAVASIAKMIGTVFSAWLWESGRGLEWLSCIWLCANILGAACYGILYQIKDHNMDYTRIPDRGQQTDLSEPIMSTVIHRQDNNHQNGGGGGGGGNGPIM